jgi:ABC-2 type transport system ATP-binding protein
MATPIVLETHHLSVPPRVLSEISLTLREGERVCVYGRSGAGKTTLLRALLELTRYRGEVVWHIPRSSAGYASQHPRLIPRATTLQQVLWCAQLHGVSLSPHGSRIHELLEQFGLGDHRQKRVRRLSPGEQAKLELCCAMAVASRLLVVDGLLEVLDETARARFWEEVDARCARRDLALVYTAHSTREAEMADRVLILHEGRLLAMDTLEHLRARTALGVVRLQPVQDGAHRQVLKGFIPQREGGIMIRDGGTAGEIILQRVPTMEDVLDTLLRQEGLR